MTDEQTRVLREHLERRSSGPREDAIELSFAEWQALERASALACLRGGPVPQEKASFLNLIEAESPHLAGKLARLSDGEFARLCFALKSGRRCSSV